MSEIDNGNEFNNGGSNLIGESVQEPRYPLMRRRVMARLIDSLIIFTLTLIFGGLLLVIWPVPNANELNLGAFEELANIFIRFAIAGVFCWALSGIYELVMVGKYGATVGKRFMKLQVVDGETLKPVTMGHSFVRILVYLSSFIVGAILGIIFGPASSLVSISIIPLAFWRIDGKSGVDLVAKTLVISIVDEKLASEDKLTGRRVGAVILALLFILSGFSTMSTSKLSSNTFNSVNQNAKNQVADQSASAVWRDIEATSAVSGNEIDDAFIDKTIIEDYSGAIYTYDSATNKLTITTGDTKSVRYICTSGVSETSC
jgi:uncharacterized RDD family membrane protein YckC